MLRGAFGSTEAYFYHVHSYHPEHDKRLGALAEAEYGAPFPTILGWENLLGFQFHPEKSGAVGLRVLKNFLD